MNKTFIDQIDGYCNEHLKRTYKKVVAEYKSNDKVTFAEVGVYKGRSLCHLAMYCEEAGLNAEVYGVDHFEGSYSANKSHPAYTKNVNVERLSNACMNNIRDAGLSNRIIIVKAKSIMGSKIFVDEELDFVFIDAEHTYGDLLADINSWLPKINKKKGFVGGHDYTNNFPGVMRAVNEVFKGKQKVIGNCWFVEYKDGQIKTDG